MSKLGLFLVLGLEDVNLQLLETVVFVLLEVLACQVERFDGLPGHLGHYLVRF